VKKEIRDNRLGPDNFDFEQGSIQSGGRRREVNCDDED